MPGELQVTPQQNVEASPQFSPGSPGRTRNPSLPALTGIRFFAAFYVVLTHSLPWIKNRVSLPLPIANFLSNGYLAVCLFFLLSGFILSYTYSGLAPGVQNYVKFWEARFARIYPVYLFSLLLALPFQFHTLTLKSTLAVLLMVQAWNPLRPEMSGAWNYPAWSLSVEAFFYLCFPFIQMRIASMSRRAIQFLAAGALLVCLLIHTPIQGLGTWNPNAVAPIPIPLPILRFPEFLLGMLMGNYFVRFGSVTRRPFLALLAILASILSLSITAGPWVSVAVLPFAVLLYSLASSRDAITTFFSRPVMFLLGGASYSVYLLQLPVRDWVRTLFSHTTASLNQFNAPLTPVILVLFSILVFRYLEEPLRKTIRRGLAARLSL
jgi:peptidoglycan/LPS O-acetylase OafA/YrhL